MSAFAFAWRSLVRQPARAALGILGVAAVGALLFDMLLLSNGLVLSMRGLLDRSGFEVRITATPALPGAGPELTGAPELAARVAALPEVDEAVALRFGDGDADAPGGGPPLTVALVGADPSHRRAWTIDAGRDLSNAADAREANARAANAPEIVINDALASAAHRTPGDTITVRASCGGGRTAMPPVTFRIVGVARFPFDTVRQMTAATSRLDIVEACGDEASDGADLILVSTAPGFEPDATRDAIARVVPGVSTVTNAQVVGRLDASGFSYFRQISAVLATVTAGFGFLLIAVLLTVSVNQRLGTVAALRAIGLSRARVIADVVCESALMVGAGGLLAIPLGLAMATWLDRILMRIPGLPGDLHFFVFERRALAVYAGILVVTAVLAALYPARLVARLPITTTLRNEVTS